MQPEIAEAPAELRANSAALVRLRSVGDGSSCVRAGALDITVDADNQTVAIESGSFVSTSTCDEPVGEDYIARIFNLAAGSWSVGLSGPDGSLVGTQSFEVLACSGCSDMCEPSSETRIGDDCQDDCDCGGQLRGGGSIHEFCVASACAQTCLWSADCPEGYRCDAGVDADGIASVGWCVAAEDECTADSDCERGACRDGQCAPRLDFTGLDSDGMGALCACDSECPGDQQCILGAREADVPRCALRCRDSRDCNFLPTVSDPAGYECDNEFGTCGTPPQGSEWRCSGLSPSGVPPVCVRY